MLALCWAVVGKKKNIIKIKKKCNCSFQLATLTILTVHLATLTLLYIYIYIIASSADHTAVSGDLDCSSDSGFFLLSTAEDVLTSFQK